MLVKRDDVYGLLGAALCFAAARFDAGWRPFWLAAGVALLVWTIGTFVVGRIQRH